MAHVVRFAIEGLAGSKGIVSCKMNRHLNVFFGLNGSGKTSLLRILHSALETDASELQSIQFRSAEVVIHSEQYNSDFRYTFSKVKRQQPELFVDTPPEAHKFRERLEHGLVTWVSGGPKWTIDPALPENGPTGWRHKFLPTTRLVFGTDEDFARIRRMGRDDTSMIEALDQQYGRVLEREWLRYSSSLQARIRSIQQTGLADIIIQLIYPSVSDDRRRSYEVDPATAFPRVLAFLSRQGVHVAKSSLEALGERVAMEPILRNVLARIDQLESDIESASSASSQLQVLLDKLFTRKRIKLEPAALTVESEGKESIPLQGLSSGEKQLLRLLIQTLDAEESTMLIDEPELSMHIDWQRELVAAMTKLNPKMQLIVATHSPEVMADVDDKYITEL